MRKLFISFTSLLGFIARKKVTEDDLRHGLFYFGCARCHAFAPGSNSEPSELEWDEAYPEAHRVMLPYLELAEAEGRIAFREVGQQNSFEMLNGLLQRNRVDGIKPRNPDGPYRDMINYCYPAVREYAAADGLEVNVMW